MKTYKVTRISRLHEIEVEAKNDNWIMALYYEGVVDEILSEKNENVDYRIEDEDGNLIHEHTFT